MCIRDRAVTVRFQVNADKTATGGAIYAINSALNALDLVQDKTAVNIAAADPVLATSPVYTTSGAMYVSSNETSQLLTEQIQPDVSFLLVEKGQTVNSGGGGGDLSNIAVVNFYDWDGTTLLGSLAVEKGTTIKSLRCV